MWTTYFSSPQRARPLGEAHTLATRLGNPEATAMASRHKGRESVTSIPRFCSLDSGSENGSYHDEDGRLYDDVGINDMEDYTHAPDGKDADNGSLELLTSRVYVPPVSVRKNQTQPVTEAQVLNAIPGVFAYEYHDVQEPKTHVIQDTMVETAPEPTKPSIDVDMMSTPSTEASYAGSGNLHESEFDAMAYLPPSVVQQPVSCVKSYVVTV